MNQSNLHKVVLIFSLKEGQANEEIKRSKEANSFPNLLAQQPGFVELELIKINEEKTMSIQTWQTEKDWWKALERVKQIKQDSSDPNSRENILLSRDFLMVLFKHIHEITTK